MIDWHLNRVEHCHTPGHFGQELDKRLKELSLGVGGGGCNQILPKRNNSTILLGAKNSKGNVCILTKIIENY